MSGNLLETRGLQIVFGGVRAIDGVDFVLPEGQIRALIGPNGAGKTTFFNAVSGWYQPTAGEIYFQGEEISGLSARRIARRGLARTFQITSVFGNLTVFENLVIAALSVQRLGAAIVGRALRRSVERAAEEMMVKVRLDRLRDVPAADLSYGDQRVLEMSLALARNPKLLLLDEPTAGMSPSETAHMVGLVRELGSEVGIIIVEHDMEIVMDLADTISVFDRGRLIAEGTPAEVQANDLVQKVYLGAA
jgi:branched-chain amino acid transport system ATP-binding protein